MVCLLSLCLQVAEKMHMALLAKKALLAMLGPVSEEEAPLVNILDRVREDSALLLTTYTSREAVLAALREQREYEIQRAGAQAGDQQKLFTLQPWKKRQGVGRGRQGMAQVALAEPENQHAGQVCRRGGAMVRVQAWQGAGRGASSQACSR